MLSAMIAFAAAAAAQVVVVEQRSVSFTVGNQAFTMPVPEGLCAPTGKLTTFAELMASADEANSTVVSLYACDRSPEVPATWEYVLIKVPRGVEHKTLAKPVAVNALKEVLESQDAPKFDQDMQDEIEAGYKDNLGLNVKFKGNFGYMGYDADCAYIGGSLTVKVEDKEGLVIGSTCMSAAGGKIMAVNYYVDPGAGDVAYAKRRSREIFVSIKPQ
ncbi:hypothetical protein [Novosphingobium sp.]|uniref:hypothetical protein n=1 Tax=Novosphingobium sp. TaxID=1874826 RepID=UPI0035ADDE3E